MNVGVYGLGRFGQFWTEFLIDRGSALGVDVYAYNRSRGEFPPAIEKRMLSLPELCSLQTLFLCTSISSVPQVAREIAPLLARHTLVMDTCSVKVYPLSELTQHLAPEQPILGTHPMFGPDSVRANPLPIVLTPIISDKASPLTQTPTVAKQPIHRSQNLPASTTIPQEQPYPSTALGQWKDLFTQMGLRVSVMNAEEHDREVARTQGITHFIGRFLASLKLHPSDISTLGFQKLFEVMEQTCNDPWQLFVDLQQYNPHTSEIRQEMTQKFNDLVKILEGHTFDS